MNESEVAAGLAASPGYRYADRVGDELVVAGQVPRDSAGELVAPDDAVAQVAKCFDNLKLLVSAHDFDLGDVRHITIYVVGEQTDLTVAWEATMEWWGGEVPPATLLGVSKLGYQYQVIEIDARVIKRT